MTCPHCYKKAHYRAQNGDWKCHFCGWIANAPDQTPEIEPRRVIVSVDIPQDEIVVKTPEKGKKGRVGMGSMFSYGTRGEYLSNHKLIEADIMLDDTGKEYWIKDNFTTGESERVYIPTRYKNARSKTIY